MKTVKTNTLAAMILLAGSAFALPSFAQDNTSGYYLKPVFGFSSLGDQTGIAENTGFENGDINVDMSSGFTAGLGWGYRYNQQFSAELYWEYRTNDSDTIFSNSGNSYSGNYASNIFYLNGYYHFPNQGQNWSFYTGAGLGYIQEIDLDIEESGVERSSSTSGDVGFQLMLGADYEFSERWTFNTELRYARFSSIELEGEENLSGFIKDLDYDPLTIGFGVKYTF